MSVIAASEPVDVERAPRRRRWTLRLLRLLLTGHAALVVLQPVLAGRFLGGDVDAIGLHATVALLIATFGLAAAAASTLHWLAGRGRFWIVPLMLTVFFAEVIQIGMGYSRRLHVHVPLGTAIVTVAVVLAGWSWSAGARQPRGRR